MTHTLHSRRHFKVAYLLVSSIACLLALPLTALAQDTLPPSTAGTISSADCLAVVGDTCNVRETGFRLTVPGATDTGGAGLNPNGYQFCRSQDVTGSGSCEVQMSSSSGATYAVTGEHRPALGKRRAYWVRASDMAGNWGPWGQPFYVATVHFDSIPPSATGPVTTSACVTTESGTCVVNPAAFTISVTAATDGDSGIASNGYSYCRSSDALGESGCEVSMTQSAGTSYVVPESHRPGPGQRRAYYARAQDQAGNVGPWSAPLYVKSLGDSISPAITSASASVGGQVLNGALVNSATPRIDVKFSATDNAGVSSYQLLVQRQTPAATVTQVSVPGTASAHALVPPALAEGAAYSVSVRALDASSNASTWVSGIL